MNMDLSPPCLPCHEEVIMQLDYKQEQMSLSLYFLSAMEKGGSQGISRSFLTT